MHSKKTPNKTNGVGLKLALSPDELADALGVSTETLRGWRSQGNGPPYIKTANQGKAAYVRYPLKAVEKWIEARTQTSTAEDAGA